MVGRGDEAPVRAMDETNASAETSGQINKHEDRMRQLWRGLEGVAFILFIGVFAAAGLFGPAPRKQAEPSPAPLCSKACEAGVFWADMTNSATIADCKTEAARRQSPEFGEGCERQMRSLSATYTEESIGDPWMPYVY